MQSYVMLSQLKINFLIENNYVSYFAQIYLILVNLSMHFILLGLANL